MDTENTFVKKGGENSATLRTKLQVKSFGDLLQMKMVFWLLETDDHVC